jgi:RNA polymerase sigma-70 factor (ECF subfamily)
MAGNKADAEDILHDAFIYAFEHIRQLREPAAFGGWLSKIVIGQCVRASKSSLRWNDLNENNTEIPSEDERGWWADVQLKQLHEDIKKLPSGCRQVFVLLVFENFGHREIAESLGISEGTSRSQYHRARRLLKESITKRISING